MKKILHVTYGFHPAPSPRSFRATELAIELARQGHEITVLGPYQAGIEEFLNQHGLNYIGLKPFKKIEENLSLKSLFWSDE